MLLADALANFARLALRTAVGLHFLRARQFAMASASGQRARDHERLLVMPAAWKARVRAVYDRVCAARPPQLRNYGAIRSWRPGVDWARAVLLPPFGTNDSTLNRQGDGDPGPFRVRYCAEIYHQIPPAHCPYRFVAL